MVKKLVIFDFDGVIVDGMQEYWHSSLLACERYLNSPNITIDQKLYQGVPNSFKEIRPWVKYGWEMILIVHEIIKTENPLKSDNKDDFINNYHQKCQKILNENYFNIKKMKSIASDIPLTHVQSPNSREASMIVSILKIIKHIDTPTLISEAIDE